MRTGSGDFRVMRQKSELCQHGPLLSGMRGLNLSRLGNDVMSMFFFQLTDCECNGTLKEAQWPSSLPMPYL